jgi:hypothetical protein
MKRGDNVRDLDGYEARGAAEKLDIGKQLARGDVLKAVAQKPNRLMRRLMKRLTRSR